MTTDLWMKEVGFRLRIARQRRGLKQWEVAETLNVDRATVTRWESGVRSPGLWELKKMAEMYSVSPDWLMGEGDALPPAAEASHFLPASDRVALAGAT